jgi:hypothetical protein
MTARHRTGNPSLEAAQAAANAAVESLRPAMNA